MVLCNNRSEAIRVAVLKLLATYLERAGQPIKNALVKQRGFLLMANQLYQYRTTSRLTETAFLMASTRAEPLIDAVRSNAGLSIKDIDASVLPACAPLLALIEGALYNDALCDETCWAVKGALFETFLLLCVLFM